MSAYGFDIAVRNCDKEKSIINPDATLYKAVFKGNLILKGIKNVLILSEHHMFLGSSSLKQFSSSVKHQ